MDTKEFVLKLEIFNGCGKWSDLRNWDIEWIHKNNYSFNASNKELLTANYTFVILRNPFKRLLSFFSDKLCNTGSNTNDKSYEKPNWPWGQTQKRLLQNLLKFCGRILDLKSERTPPGSM